MAKKSLLKIVQDILNDLDSDEVNSINDTVESMQVAQIVQSCYEELSTNRNWPHQKRIMQLEASGTLSRPNYLKIPPEVKELLQFKYEKSKVDEDKLQYLDVKFLYPDEFLQLTCSRDSSADNVQTVLDTSGVSLLIFNDKAPEYWTTFDDEWLVCDSYDLEVDSTLQKSKTQIVCYKELDFSLVDDFIPEMPSEAFPLLVEEAKSTAFLVLKQMANQKAEQKAGRQQRWLSRKAWKAHGGIRYENYGRKGNK